MRTATSPGHIVLSQLGAGRIGLQTAAAQPVPTPPPVVTTKILHGVKHTTVTTPAPKPAAGVIIPYSAIIYDPSGKTYAFIKAAPLTYTEVPITIDHDHGGSAYLTGGPTAGAQVVTVGAEELYGVQTGVLAQTEGARLSGAPLAAERYADHLPEPALPLSRDRGRRRADVLRRADARPPEGRRVPRVRAGHGRDPDRKPGPVAVRGRVAGHGPARERAPGRARVTETESESVPQLSAIFLYFKNGTDVLQARQLVQERLGAAASSLPSGPRRRRCIRSCRQPAA